MTSYLVNCSILFTELPLPERPAAAREAGFDAVEFWWPFDRAVPTNQEMADFVAAVRDAGVRLVGLNFPAGDLPAGDRGLVSWPGRAEEFRAGVECAVSIGEQLGVRVFNALYGNRVDSVDAVTAIGRVPADNVRLLADLYHLAINGDDVDAVIARHAGGIGHVQVADAPGRHQPGTGRLPIGRWLAALDDAGYAGWVGLEYVPDGPSAASLDWLPRDARTTREISA